MAASRPHRLRPAPDARRSHLPTLTSLNDLRDQEIIYEQASGIGAQGATEAARRNRRWSSNPRSQRRRAGGNAAVTTSSRTSSATCSHRRNQNGRRLNMSRPSTRLDKSSQGPPDDCCHGNGHGGDRAAADHGAGVVARRARCRALHRRRRMIGSIHNQMPLKTRKSIAIVTAGMIQTCTVSPKIEPS